MSGQYRRWCWTLFRGFQAPLLPGDAVPDVARDDSPPLQPLAAAPDRPRKRKRRRQRHADAASEDSSASSSDDSSSSSEEEALQEAEHRPQDLNPGEPAPLWIPDPQAVIAALRGIGGVYTVCQLESAPGTGRRHLQGYTRFSKPLRMAGLQTALPGGHFEPAKADEAANVAYCSKSDSRLDGPWSDGDAARPGKRNDISVAKKIVADGGGMRSVISQVNSYQAMKTAELCLKYVERKRTWLPDVRWYHGSTGGGKTRQAIEEFPDAWMSGRNLKWFEGYDAHEVIVIDDFRKDFCTFHELLRILDRYEYRIENKGSSRQLLAKTIIITCPWAPAVLYDNRSAEDVSQLIRRISVVRQFGEVVPPPQVYPAAQHGFVSL